jgi:hypothetical protein
MTSRELPPDRQSEIEKRYQRRLALLAMCDAIEKDLNDYEDSLDDSIEPSNDDLTKEEAPENE